VVAALAAIAGTETREAPGATQAAGGTRELAAGTFGVVAGGTQPLPAVGGLPPIGGTLELPGENRGARDEGLAAGGAREEAPAPGGTGAPRALSSTPAEWPSGSIPADVPTRPDADEIVARLSRPGGGGGGRGGRDRGGGGDSGGDSGDAGEARPAPALQSERRWLRGVWGWARIAALCVAGPLAVTAWIRHQQTADLRGRLDKVTHALHEPPLPADCACELADEGKLLGLGDLRTKPSAALARLGSVSEGCVLRWTLSARAFLAAGDPIAAKGAARRALSICSGAAAAEHLLGEAAMKLGDGEGAVAAWRRAAAVAPAFAAPQVSLALAALDKKDAAGAVTLMSALIARDRYAPNAFLARGRAYLALDDPEAAARDLDEAVLQGPNDRDAWFVLGVARERSSPDQARQAFCRASALGRADAAARCKRSRPRNPESRPTTLD
jgi:Flp pilus assembly protein TadD